MANTARRREKDVMALLMSDYDVDLGNAAGDFGVSSGGRVRSGSSPQQQSSISSSSSSSRPSRSSSGGPTASSEGNTDGNGTNSNGLIEEFTVKFHGPEDTPYEGGLWYVNVRLPQQYPFKSPSIGFQNKMFHPNVDESSGSVCLDVISQTWTPMYDLVNIFDQFLPQLLRYPNPTDPLNGEAAHLLLREPEQYRKKVKDYVIRFASESALNGDKESGSTDEMRMNDGDEDNMSEVSELSDL